MNFKKGDKVKFLYQSDSGIVTSILGDGKVMVLNSDDFEVPVLASELILDAAASAPEPKPQPPAAANDRPRAGSLSAKAAKPAAATLPGDGDVAFYAGFVPEEGQPADGGSLDLYFINDSHLRICYNYLRPVEGSPLMMCKSGIIEPGIKEYVETFSRQALGALSVFKFQLMFSSDRMPALIKPAEAELRIHAPKLCQRSYFKESDFFDDAAVVLPIYQSGKMAGAIRAMMDSQLQGKDSKMPEKHSQPKKPKRSDKEVVDLHLSEIIEDESGLSPKDMLDYQMKVFRDKLDEYIKDPHVQKVVFIHGKGNGTLKLELRKCLERNYKRCEYQDASFEEYGGGATLVYVK